jgi:hypothetical protein
MLKQASNWWEGPGKPEYGGELVIRANNDIVNFDPYNSPGGNIHSAWLERLVSDDWTLDRPSSISRRTGVPRNT